MLERLVHSSGDPGLAPLLRFSPAACEQGLEALRQGALVLTDTAMAAAAVSPMARRTLGTSVRCLLDWAPPQSPEGSTRSAAAMQRCWPELTTAAQTAGQPMPLLLVGSAPTALEQLLDQLDAGGSRPALVIGMPVGFVGVPESKRRLASTSLDQIRLEKTAAVLAWWPRRRMHCSGLLRLPIDPVPGGPVALPVWAHRRAGASML